MRTGECQTVNFESELERKGYIVYTNVGDSMMPLLREKRDVLVIRKVTEPLKKYDTVLFKRPNGKYVLHRIVKVRRDGTFRIVGDNRPMPETVPGEWIIGLLTEVIRDGRRISVDSDEYRAYVKTVPMRRLKLQIRFYPAAAVRKGIRILRKAVGLTPKK